MSDSPDEALSAPGSVCWTELATSDMPASEKFYSELFGWKFEAPPGMDGYKMVMSGDMPVAGMMDKSEHCDGPPLWLSYIHVEDVSASLQKAVDLGAEEMRGVTEIPGKGSFAMIKDPQDGLIAIWQPAGS